MEDIQKLYELYSVDVYKFILSLSKDTYIAEDVMQSTFFLFGGGCILGIFMAMKKKV